MDDVFTKYRLVRARFLYVTRDFSEQALGSGLEEHATRLSQEFESSVDTHMLRLFQNLDLRGNPDVLRKLFRSWNPIPELQLDVKSSLDGWYNWEKHAMYLVDNSRMRNSYDYFRHVFIHEFAHGWIGHGNRAKHQRLLNEGIAELLAFQLTKYRYGRAEELSLAEALYELDKDLLLDWFVSYDDDRLRESLVESLSRFHDEAEAREIADRVGDLQEEANRTADSAGLRFWLETMRDMKDEYENAPSERKLKIVDQLRDEQKRRIDQAIAEYFADLVAKIRKR